MKGKENTRCEFGEVNPITKEFWCNKHQEFCKFINPCYKKEDI